MRCYEVYDTSQFNGFFVASCAFITNGVTPITFSVNDISLLLSLVGCAIRIKALIKCYDDSYHYLRDCSQRCSYDFKSDNQSSLVSH